MPQETRTRGSMGSRMAGVGRGMGKGATVVGKGATAAGKRGAAALSSLVVLATTVAALVLGLHIVFAIFDANPDNGIVSFTAGLSDILAWKFQDLFLLKRDSLQILVNFGAAAGAYLLAGRLAANVIRRLS